MPSFSFCSISKTLTYFFRSPKLVPIWGGIFGDFWSLTAVPLVCGVVLYYLQFGLCTHYHLWQFLVGVYPSIPNIIVEFSVRKIFVSKKFFTGFSHDLFVDLQKMFLFLATTIQSALSLFPLEHEYLGISCGSTEKNNFVLQIGQLGSRFVPRFISDILFLDPVCMMKCIALSAQRTFSLKLAFVKFFKNCFFRSTALFPVCSLGGVYRISIFLLYAVISIVLGYKWATMVPL